ncbi:MAG TPA: Mur ligase domain-containing protein [Planctomycetota bacterium]|nr:Mur ligase domain-containing protein [Planctomycetota bacterium]
MPKEHAHLVGVAGVGMNPLAQALLACGWQVSGSDRYLDAGQDVEVIPKLRRAGVRLVPQDGSGITRETQAVVVSTAIEPGNPDLDAAARCGVPVVHRAEMLARLMAGRECIAVTGTSGKTTVTGMVGFVLEQLGDDPTVVNGGIVVNWEDDERVGNVRVGRSGRWVIEADESDRSLLRFAPEWAIITNISADHFPLDETRKLFADFAANVGKALVVPKKEVDEWMGGWLDERKIALPLIQSSTHPLIQSLKLSASGSRFDHKGQEFRLPLLGRHNAQNALQAVMLCERLGHRLDRIAGALAEFRGIRRRLDVAGTAGGVTVIDDYAHNPAKIRAAWEAVAPYYQRVLAVWRPHGFGPLAKMLDDLKALFADLGRRCERLYILPVYYVGGTATASVTSDVLVSDLAAAGVPAELVPDYDELIRRVVARARPGDVVLSMGARDPDLPGLARRLVAALASTRRLP